MAQSDIQESIRSAVLEHFRWWVFQDKAFIDSLKTSQGVDPNVLRSIAVAYQVSRGILNGCEKEVADLLSSAAEGDWPSSLKERAEEVEKLAIRAYDEGLTNGRQVSAFSKFVWFLRPSDWTMYDQYASGALEKMAEEDLSFVQYYERLDEYRFSESCQKLRSVLDQSDFRFLWAERIIDKYLMIKGMTADESKRQSERLLAFEKGWRDMIDPGFSGKLDRLAGDLTDAVSGQPLFGGR